MARRARSTYGRVATMAGVLLSPVIAAFSSGCASAGHQAPPEPQARPAFATPNTVDLRGIWEGTKIDPVGLRAQGLDPDDVAGPIKTRNVNPRFPAAARRDRATGTVLVECLIDVDGIPKHCHVVQSPHEALSAESVRAAEEWRYTPLTVRGEPRPALVYLDFHFRFS